MHLELIQISRVTLIYRMLDGILTEDKSYGFIVSLCLKDYNMAYGHHSKVPLGHKSPRH